MYSRRIDVISLESCKVLRRYWCQVGITHNQLSKMVDAVGFMHGSIDWILWVHTGIDGHSQVVETMQSVKSVQASYVPAVVHVPVYRRIRSIGFVSFLV